MKWHYWKFLVMVHNVTNCVIEVVGMYQMIDSQLVYMTITLLISLMLRFFV